MSSRGKIIEAENLADYYTGLIKISAFLMPEGKKLTSREIDFLVGTVILYHEGADISVFKTLANYLIDNNIVNNYDVAKSLKKKVAAKGWVKTKKGVLLLPQALMRKPEIGDSFSITLQYNQNNELDKGNLELRGFSSSDPEILNT